MDYYKRYMGDYGRDTSRLSMIEHGAYNLLLDDYYSTRTPLPADLNELYRICRATTKPEQTAVESVAKRYFPVCDDGQRHSKRADEEIAKWEIMAEENREKGKLGGRPKKNPSGTPTGNPTGSGGDNPEETHRVNGGLPKEGVLETRKKPSPNPNPNPDPKPEPIQRHSENARARGEGDSIATTDHEPATDTLPFEQAIMATYPKGSNPPNWMVALRCARELVSDGLATWPDLVAVTQRYAAHFAASGGSTNLAAHNFFDRRKGNHWQQPWEPSAAVSARAAPKKRWHPDDGDPFEPKVATP